MRKRYDDEDDSDIFEADGKTVRDGKSVRVPVMLMDHGGGLRIADARTDSVGLHRPGYRVETGGGTVSEMMRFQTADARRRAYELYDREVTEAYLLGGDKNQQSTHRRRFRQNAPVRRTAGRRCLHLSWCRVPR